MTEDRKNLLRWVAQMMYSRRCRCGRCDCVTSDPVELARRGLLQWSLSYRERLPFEMGRAALYRKFEREAARSKNPLIRARRHEHEENALRHERVARRIARAALRYERLARGLHPFRAAADETPRQAPSAP